jgi:hypothetical protein|tara:strand:+ start:338 stop:586 length:249 start_codon:yes stop_codon:yes gene_type:complete
LKDGVIVSHPAPPCEDNGDLNQQNPNLIKNLLSYNPFMSSNSSAAGAKILAAGPDDLPDVKDIAYAIWYEHYPGIITHKQIA